MTNKPGRIGQGVQIIQEVKPKKEVMQHFNSCAVLTLERPGCCGKADDSVSKPVSMIRYNYTY
jgi:hypothetical protein